ncbi:MAG TPA: efflux transporter periplasmic adaptor subunit, partial [Clostridiales bacterium]|nr:efflux transporter periplasmic adaptor subunit [Clostridiales bacterium]
VVLSSAKAKSIEIQKQELEKKKEDLSKVFIKSPIDGTITRVNVNLGRYAKDTSSEKAMFTVENLDKLQMKVFISEFDIGKISVGQEVEITSDVMGKDKTAGIVSRISPTAEQKDNNTMERVIPVVIDIIEKPANLIAGVSATAKIKVARAENIFAVSPGMLITDEENQNKIFTLNGDNTVKSVIVETGLETDLEIEIRSSELADGMKVIANPDMSFTDGMTVRPNDAAE